MLLLKASGYGEGVAYPEYIEAVSTFASGYGTITFLFQPQPQMISPSSCSLMVLHCRVLVHGLSAACYVASAFIFPSFLR